MHEIDCHFYIHIFFKEELEEIKNKVIEELKGFNQINGNMIKLLKEKYHLSDRDMRDILGSGYALYKKAIEENKSIAISLKKENKLNYFEIFEKWKNKEEISYEDVKSIQEQYQLSQAEIQEVFQISKKNFKDLLDGSVQKVKVDLYSEKDRYLIKKKVNLQEKYRVSKKDMERVAQNEGISVQRVGQILDVNQKCLKRLMDGKQLTLKISDKNTKWKVDRMLLDLKYNPIYGERYYTSDELKFICNHYKLDVKDFFRCITRGKVLYETFLEAEQKNPKGVWIGSKTRISNEFIEKNYEKMDKMIDAKARRKCAEWRCDDKDDLKSEAFEHLLREGGIFERNLDYDEESLVMKLMSQTGGAMLKYHQENVTDWSLQLRGQNGDYENEEALQDNRYNPEVCLIKETYFHVKELDETCQNILKSLKYNDNFAIHYPKNVSIELQKVII